MVVPNDHPVRKWKVVDSDGFVHAENIDREVMESYCQTMYAYRK